MFRSRPITHSLTPYAAAKLAALGVYVDKVDPTLGEIVTVLNGEPDYGALQATRLAVVVGARNDCWMRRLRQRTGLHESFEGGVATNQDRNEYVPITLLDRWDPTSLPARPDSFRVLVIVTVFNEADVLEQLLARLTQGGAHVHVIDNWSNDATTEIVERFSDSGAVTSEQFPSSGSTGHFELERLLRRVEEVAADSGADWVIHHDADEIRQSPWPDVSLIDALWAVEQWGYNCIDHTVFNFRPVENSWTPGDDLAASFSWGEFGNTPADFLQIKGWKPQETRLDMASNAGHQVQFEGRRIFPYKFLLRHYSIRSQAHGERKILRERQPRWSPEERAKGWHVHYDHYDDSTSFLWDPSTLLRWEGIDEHFLIERLSGVGMTNNPWTGEGPILI